MKTLVIFATSMANNMTYEELVKKHPGSLVEKIVTEVVSKNTVEVHFEIEDDEPWSAIKVHVYEEDKEMAIRLLSDDRWILQFGYYDDDDEFIELLQPLTQPEIDLIPKVLQKVSVIRSWQVKKACGFRGISYPDRLNFL